MRKITVLDRILFLITAIIAGCKIVSGMEQHSVLSTGFYTVSFGVLVLASIMLILFGFELLTNRFIPVVTTLIPITLSLGLVHDYIPKMTFSYSVLLGLLYLISVWVRFTASEKTAALVLALVHGLSGMLLFVLPVVLVTYYGLPLQLLLVSLGGLIIGLEGIFLTLQKMGFLKMSLNTVFSRFPVMLLLATLAFVSGLHV